MGKNPWRPSSFLFDYIGRRGALLVMIGALWMLRGVAIARGTEANLTPSAGLFHLLLPDPLRATLWLFTGALAIFCAFYQTPRRQALGYAALVLLPIERGLSYLGAWVLHLLGYSGLDNGWSSAVGWASVIALLLTISGWEEPPAAGREAAKIQ